MTAYNYIKIQGFDGDRPADVDPGIFEMFRGLGGERETTVDLAIPKTPIAEDGALAQAIWDGQTAKIQKEIVYCDQLNTLLKRKHKSLTDNKDSLLDFLKEVIEEAVGSIVTAALIAKLGSLALVIGFFAEQGVGWLLDQLEDLLTRGCALLDSIKAEDQQLLQVEISRENYEYREDALARHREDIRMVLEQINTLSRDLQVGGGGQMSTSDELIQAIKDLQFNDEVIDFGAVRLHLRNKIIEY